MAENGFPAERKESGRVAEGERKGTEGERKGSKRGAEGERKVSGRGAEGDPASSPTMQSRMLLMILT